MSQQEAQVLIDGFRNEYEKKYEENKISFSALIKAIIKRESDFNTTCVTPELNVKDFSAGFMQVRLDTARWLLGKWFASDKQMMEIVLDPITNMKVGIRYITQQLKRYDWDMDKAIAAYNSGTAKYRKPNVFINQDYVDYVKKYYYKYLAEEVNCNAEK